MQASTPGRPMVTVTLALAGALSGALAASATFAAPAAQRAAAGSAAGAGPPWQAELRHAAEARAARDWERARIHFEEAARSAASAGAEPGAAQARARAIEGLASLLRSLGQPRAAVERYAAAAELRREAGEAGTHGAAAALLQRAAILERLEEPAAAEPLLREALLIQESAPQPMVSATMTRLAEAVRVLRPDDPEAEELLRRAAETWPGAERELALGAHLAAVGRPAEAAEAFERARAAVEREPRRDRWLEARILADQASARLAAGDVAAAELALGEALEARRAELGPDHPSLAEAWRELGTLLLDEERWADAELALETALALREAGWGACHECLGDLAALVNRARGALGRDETAGCGAGPRATEAADAAEPAHGIEPITEPSGDERRAELARLEREAEALRRRGETAAASELATRAFELRQALFGADSDEAAAGRLHLARILEERLAEDEARVHYLALIAGEATGSAAARRMAAAALHQLAGIARRCGDPGGAAALYEREWLLRETLGEELAAARALEALGQAWRAADEERRAGEWFLRAAERWREVAGDAAPEVRRNLAALAESYVELGLHDDAIALCQRLLADLPEDETRRWLGDVLRPLERAARALGREELARGTAARLGQLEGRRAGR